MMQLDGLKAMKGAHSLGQRDEKNERLWLGLLLEGKNCRILFLFYKYCNVNLFRHGVVH
jgi:hypothetical protein